MCLYILLNDNLDFLLSSHLIKLITDPRRVGKSTQALLMLRDRNFAYLNFDNYSLLEAWDADLVMRMLDDVYPGYEYILLDEVQNLDGWNLWVSELYRIEKNLVITGSNAKMLSSDIANELTTEPNFSSVNTTKNIWDYLHEPYLFYYLSRYNNKLKLMKKAPRKVYVVDNGFVSAKAFSLSDNLGRLLDAGLCQPLYPDSFMIMSAICFQ